MKAGFVAGRNKVEVRDVKVPGLSNGEILVRMKASGICGTDVEKVRGESVTAPVLGHEVAGEIAKVSQDVTEFKLGERVAVHHHVPCYRCYYCRHGDYTMCEEFPKVNLDPCGFAEYFRVPAEIVQRGGVVRLPDNLSYEEGALLEPTGCCIRAINSARPSPGDSAAVIGCGPTGVTHIQLLKETGCGKVIGIDVIHERLDWARRFGADVVFNAASKDSNSAIRSATEGRGPDVVVVAAGSPRAIMQGYEIVRKGGKVVLFGAPPKGSSLSFDPSTLFIHEIKTIPSYSTTETEIGMALRLIAARRIDVSSMVTQRFDLERLAKAIKVAEGRKEALKVMIVGE